MKKTNNFNTTDELLINPYTGFASFQHFRGEKLYSDCITGRPGVASTETENYECYPVPEGVEEKGREQGYYPDNTIAYIRILWKEFEPKQGEYNYDFIQGILDKAKEKGQTVMFRLMPHSTCARDDVPDWIKEMMPCPERPDGMRVKDSPTDPRYLKLFGKAIKKLGERFDSNPVLDSVDVSLGGAWGEGSQDFPESEMQALMDLYVEVFPNTKLLGQMANNKMLHYIGEKRPIGWRADGTGSPKHMNEIFPPRIADQKIEFWKTAPISFESYWWISEWKRQGWDIDHIIAKTLEWHISSFNTKSFPIPYEWQDKIENWIKKMGYRLAITSWTADTEVQSSDKYNATFEIENLGVAPMYNKLPFKVLFKNGDKVFEKVTDIDVCKWLPGKYTESISVDLDKIPAGDYQVEVLIGGGEYPVVKMATDAKKDGDAYVMASVTVK